MRHRWGENRASGEGLPSARALLNELEGEVDPDALRDLRRALPALVADLSRELGLDPLPIAAIRETLVVPGTLLDAALLSAHLQSEVDLAVAQAPTDEDRASGIETAEGVYAYVSVR